MNNLEKTVSNHQVLLRQISEFLDKNDFKERQSPGLLQPRFGYPFSPSAGHHVVDEIVISRKEEFSSILKFYVIPDRSIRMHDTEKIGISFRHLGFFETLVFGYGGAIEKLPKEVSVEVLCKLMIDVLRLDKDKLFVTTLGSCEAENTKLTEEEDKIFYDAWVKYLGRDKIAKTKGRRNLFYSRILGNPGGTGCEVYYKIGSQYVEIGSQVNYKFRFTGGLERTTNQAILEGFGFERLLMALENKTSIYDTSLLKPFKDVISEFLQSQKDKSVELYDETLNVIAEHIRTISFIVYDGQELDNSARGRILKKFIKNLHSQFVYLGIKEKDELILIDKLFDTLIQLFSNRYKDISETRETVMDFINQVIK